MPRMMQEEEKIGMVTVEQELQQSETQETARPFSFQSPESVALQQFVQDRRTGRFLREAELPSYAVPVDNDVRRTLGLIPFGRRIDDILERMIQFQLGATLHNAVRVSPRQFSSVYRVVDRCSNRLGIAVPRVMITPDLRIHAFTVGTNENHFILLTSAMVEKCTEEELMFLVGHECGHIHCRHLTYLALARTLAEWTTHLTSLARVAAGPLQMLFQVPLAAWQRKAELTCDRAGLICARDLGTSLRAMAKQVVQASALADQMDLEEYLRQLESASEESTLSKIPEYVSAFPFAPKRMASLKLFSRSELFYESTQQEKSGDLLSREDLEKGVDRVTSIL